MRITCHLSGDHVVTFIDRGITGRGTDFVGDIIVLDTWFEVYEEHPVGIFGEFMGVENSEPW